MDPSRNGHCHGVVGDHGETKDGDSGSLQARVMDTTDVQQQQQENKSCEGQPDHSNSPGTATHTHAAVEGHGNHEFDTSCPTKECQDVGLRNGQGSLMEDRTVAASGSVDTGLVKRIGFTVGTDDDDHGLRVSRHDQKIGNRNGLSDSASRSQVPFQTAPRCFGHDAFEPDVSRGPSSASAGLGRRCSQGMVEGPASLEADADRRRAHGTSGPQCQSLPCHGDQIGRAHV